METSTRLLSDVAFAIAIILMWLVIAMVLTTLAGGAWFVLTHNLLEM